MMSMINENGLILKASSYKEKDKLLTFYASSLGKIQVLCKAARDPMNHWVSSIDPPLLAWCSLLERNHFFQLTDIREMNVFPGLREHYRSRLVYHALLQAIHYTEVAEPAEEPFRLFLETLLGIEKAPENAEWFYYRFMIHFLNLQGFQRDITTCIQCHTVISDDREPFYFSLDTASFLCPECAKKELNIVQVSQNVGSIWKKCQHSAPQDFLKEKVVFFHNFKDLDRIISVIVKQVFHQDFVSLAEIVL